MNFFSELLKTRTPDFRGKSGAKEIQLTSHKSQIQNDVPRELLNSNQLQQLNAAGAPHENMYNLQQYHQRAIYQNQNQLGFTSFYLLMKWVNIQNPPCQNPESSMLKIPHNFSKIPHFQCDREN